MKHEGFSFFVFGAMIYHGVLNATCVSPYIDIVLTFFFLQHQLLHSGHISTVIWGSSPTPVL